MIHIELNNSGAWKRVLSVKDGKEAEAKILVDSLMTLAFDGGARTSWRLKDEVGPVLAYWTTTDGWKVTAPRAAA